MIEFLDKNIINNMEFHNQSIDAVIDSEVYKYMINNNYHLVNWLHSDLIFVHNDLRK